MNSMIRKGQAVRSACTVLDPLLTKDRNHLSDDDMISHPRIVPCFRCFIGLLAFQYETLVDAHILMRFRQRITLKILDWGNKEHRDIERNCGIVWHRHTLDCVIKKLKHTSEVSVRMSVLLP